MIVRHVQDGKIFIEEWRLCVNCYRMFSLNRHNFICVTMNDRYLYAHTNCPPLKQRVALPK